MTAATFRLRRRGIGAGVAALVGLSGLGFAAMPAQAAVGFDPAASQVSGVDRFDTAAQIAVAAFPTGSDTVVVANGDRAIDAQAGAYAAGLNNAPILLTQKSSVPAFTVDAIEELGATKAIVLGDENSVDAAALAQMTAAGLDVTVVAGEDRFETAADIYDLGTTKASTVFLARADLLAGQVSPDALAASPLSFKGTPVLLTNAGSLPQATADAITDGGVTNVVVLGNAITDSVKAAITALGATVTTIAGDDRSLTAQKIADYGISLGAYQKTTATIANGDKIDALAAGPWAAKNNAPILLTLGTNALGTGTTNYLTANASTLTDAAVFGDTSSVPATLTAAAKTAAGGDAPALQSLAVSPTTPATLTLANESGTTPTSDDRTYTVTGLTDATQYRVTLVKASNVTVANGTATFAIDRAAQTVTSTNPDGANGQQASGNYLAAAGTVNATFGTVNGGAPANNAGVGTTSTTTVTNSVVANPVNGSITFTVDSAVTDSVIPVVYKNGGTDRALADGGPSFRLELNAQGVPVEFFGLGGAATYINPAATSQTVPTSTAIASVSKATNQFDALNSTFTYKAGDTFSIGGVPATLDEFEAALSSGDTFGGAYSATTAASTFALVDANPTAPTAVTAIAGTTGNTTNDITVSATLAAGDFDSLVVQRAVVTGSTVGAFTTVASPTTDADADATNGFQYVDTDVPVGTYRYQVAVVNDGQQTAFVANTNNATSATPAADTTGPIATVTARVTDGGFAGILDSGDVFTVQANEALALPAAGSVIRVTDGSVAGSSVADLIVGTNVTVSLNSAAIPSTPSTTANAGAAANTVLTVRVTAAPTVVTAGDVAGIAYPATIVNTSGVTDVAGNRLDLGTGSDVIIN